MSLEVGSVIQGRYRITRLIGRGGMGSVYEGQNTSIARRVAIKVLHPDLNAHPDALERFEREAQAAGRIGNDHILEVLDLGELPSGDRFMVMEYLAGETMEARLERCGMLTATQAVPLVRQLLLGLGAAHDKGIIHRDLKPENVFIMTEKAGHSDFVKIIDFGISKFTAAADLRMTATGAVMGTPFYMSPEQAKGSRQVDTRSDLYAVGVILYRAVTGHVPFSGENFNEVLFKVVLSEAKNPRELAPALEQGFETIIARAMARDPDHRFQTAQHFVAALDAWLLDGSGVSAPPPDRTSIASMPQIPAHWVPPQLGAAQSLSPASAHSGVTSGEWTQSGLRKARRTSSALWIAGGAFAAVGAIVVFMLWPNDDGPTTQTATDLTAQATTADSKTIADEAATAGANSLGGTAGPQAVADGASNAGHGNSVGGDLKSGSAAAGSGETASGGPEVSPVATGSGDKEAVAQPPRKKRPAAGNGKKPAASRPATPTPDKPANNDELDFGY